MNRVSTQMPRAAAHRLNRTGSAIAIELTDTELQAVAGGLNPQPLPPRVAFMSFAAVLPSMAFRWF